MHKEVISDKQAIVITAMFIMGSTLVLGVGGEAKQDVWLSITLGMIIAIPMMLVYAKILSLFHGKDVFEIMEMVFGKIFGKITIIFFTWYAFHLGSLVVRNFAEFINTVTLPETPRIILMLIMAVLCIWVVQEGIEALGRWSSVIFPSLLAIILIVVALSMTQANTENLKPVLGNGLSPVIGGAFSVFTFPFAEAVLLMVAYSSLPNKKSPKKVYLIGLLIAGFFLLGIAVRNVLVLGADTVSILYFPSYTAVSKINIGDFLQRIEVMVSVVFIFAGFVKISICLHAACKGVCRVLNINNYRFIVSPVGLMMVNLAYWIYPDIMEMQNWAFKIYKYYALPFEVILPITILIVAAIRIRSGKLKVNNPKV